MKKLLYILFLVLLSSQSFSQTFADKKFYLIDSLKLEVLTNDDRELIDSCLTLYHQTKEDTNRINALNSICENMMHDDWEKYQFFQYELINKALKTHHSNLITQHLKKALASALNNIGLIYSNKGNLSQALMYYQKSLKIQQEFGENKGVSTTLNNIGLIYKNQGDIPKALDYYHKALKIREEIGDKYGIAQSFNNIGFIYNNLNNIPKALEYFHKALKIQEEIGDKQGVARSLNNIGAIYKNQGENEKAIEYYQQSLAIQEQIGDKQGTAISFNNIGVIYNNQKDFAKALEYYSKSLKIQEEIGDNHAVSYTLNNIGSIELKQNKLESAINYGIRSMAIARKIGYPANIKSSAELLYQVYEKQGKGLKALDMYKLFVQMNDSINNEETEKAAAQQQAKYDYEKQKAIDDAEHEKQLAVEQEAQAKQKVITYATAGGLGLVVIFLIFVFNRLQVTRKQKNIIETQKLEVEQQKEVVEKAHLLLEEKNSEIIASIRYAKRIQDALMTSQKYIERNIIRLKTSK